MNFEITVWPLVSMPLQVGLNDISLTEDLLSGFYRNYSNRVIWPSLHGYPADHAAAPDAWQAYLRVNRDLAKAAAARTHATGRVIVREYPLMLVPAFLRAFSPDRNVEFTARSGFDDQFMSIPRARELMEGMLAADVIVLPNEASRDAFSRSAFDLGFDVPESRYVCNNGRTTRLEIEAQTSFVDPVRTPPDEAAIAEEQGRMTRAYGIIALSVDQLNHAHAIPQRLLGFEEFLNNRDSASGDVSLLQIAVARSSEEAHADLRRVIEEISQRINQRHGTTSWKPVDVLYETAGLNTLIALYRSADLFIATRFTPGPYAVVDEFLAAASHKKRAVIVSNSARQHYRGAWGADPHRPADIAHAMAQAMTHISRQQTRLSAMPAR